MKNVFSRRSFLKTSAAGAGPLFLPARLFGADAPSKKITLGCIGVGTHGLGVNLASFLEEPDARVISVCDVYKGRRETAQKKVHAKYGNTDCKAIADFRDILADPAIDAVVISTPDHWHTPIAMMALAAGKDVFCEKPTLTIAEGRELVNEVKRRNAVYQIGLEDRSLIHYHKLADIVRNGGIGKLERMEVVLPAGNVYALEKEQPVPEGLDFNMWLGPAPAAPYSPTRLTPQGWRNIRDYSGGKFTDWGSHLLDTAQVANFAEETSPVEVKGTGEVPENALTDLPVSYHLEYRYANGVEMIVDAGAPVGSNSANANLKFIGSDGWVGITGWRGRLDGHDTRLFKNEWPAESNKLWPRPPREHRNFLDCIASRKETTYPAEHLHRLSSTMHIGNIAMELGQSLKWNPETENFEGNEAANKLKRREQRRDWATAG